MAKKVPRRRSRDRCLTAEEAAKYDTIRRQVEEEFAGRILRREASPAVQRAIAALKSAREAQGLSLADIRDRTGIERLGLEPRRERGREYHRPHVGTLCGSGGEEDRDST